MARTQRGRNRGRNRGRGNGFANGQTRGDWVVGSSSTDVTGTVGTLPSFNGVRASNVIASGGALTFQLWSFPVLALTSNPPLVGEATVNMIHGSLFFETASAAGLYTIGIGAYVSKYNNSGTKWDTRLPSSSLDAQRDDYIYLRCIELFMQVNANLVADQVIEVPISIPGPITFGGGQALHLTIDNPATAGGGGGTITVMPFVRSHITRSY